MKYIDMAWLEHQYSDLNRSALDIASELGVDVGTVLSRLRKHNIKVRNNRLSAMMAIMSLDACNRLNDPTWLHAQYVVRGRSAPNIASELGVTRSSVTNALKRFEIFMRSTAESNHLSRISSDARAKLDNPAWLKDEYLNKMRNSNDIASECNVSGHTITAKLRAYKIPVRSFGESHTGKLHPGWRNGSSYAPYCHKFNEQFKDAIRARFNYRCYICGNGRGSKDLAVHHIDYNKNSICNGHAWAFVPLCASCHSKSNMNRWHWFNLLINYWAMNADINFALSNEYNQLGGGML